MRAARVAGPELEALAWDWIDRHPSRGESPAPPSWSAAVRASGRVHAQELCTVLNELGADAVTRALAVLACAEEVPGDDWWPRGDDGELLDTLPTLLTQTLRVLRLSGSDFELDGRDLKAGVGQVRTERIRQMLVALSTDIRVVQVKLASGLCMLRLAIGGSGQDPGGSAAPGDARRLQAAAVDARLILAPLASRMGLYSIKWALEDLAFRVLEPAEYFRLAGLVESTRGARQAAIDGFVQVLKKRLDELGVGCSISGRPKHLYSLHRKLSRKRAGLDGIHDLLAIRVIARSVMDCYRVLDEVHRLWTPVMAEYDDYIAHPKPNGYRSLHTVVQDEAGTEFEVQLRTMEMHELAEKGGAAHWRYKEAGPRDASPRDASPRGAGPQSSGKSSGKMTGQSSGSSSGSSSDTQARGVAAAEGGEEDRGAARVAWLRQLIEWQQEVGGDRVQGPLSTVDPGWVFVVSPQGRIVELQRGATPVDFAYRIHTDLGHRCRGARVDGRLVALNTPLRNGQVVEIISVRRVAGEAPGPSRDWLNPALGFIQTRHARSKVRLWFNQAERAADLARGRERVEKAMAREGRSGMALELLASAIGASSVQHLFLQVARDQVGPRQLEEAVRLSSQLQSGAAVPGTGAGPKAAAGAARQGAGGAGASMSPAARALASGPMRFAAANAAANAASNAPAAAMAGAAPGIAPTGFAAAIARATGASSAGTAQRNGLVVLGVDFLLTQLARCCHPVPPDAVDGYITRGRGVSIHRQQCRALEQLRARWPERIVGAQWGQHASPEGYPVAIDMDAMDRHGLSRDVADLLARERIPLLSMRSHSADRRIRIHLVARVRDVQAAERLLAQVGAIRGVEAAARS